jgi:hypothetical protein
MAAFGASFQLDSEISFLGDPNQSDWFCDSSDRAFDDSSSFIEHEERLDAARFEPLRD